MQKTTPKWVRLKDKAQTLHRTGDHTGATRAQMAALAWAPPEHKTRLHKYLGAYASAAGKYRVAINSCEWIHKQDRSDFTNTLNLCFLYNKIKAHGKVMGLFDAYLKSVPSPVPSANTIDFYSIASKSLYEMGNVPAAHKLGEKSMVMRDELSAIVATGDNALKSHRVPPFNAANSGRNVIAFSLWGSSPKYAETILANVEAAKHVYPEWRCRIYLDQTVPDTVLGKLQLAGAQLVFMPPQQFPFEGLFWRFHVANDPGVDRFLIRDADSIVNIRERSAVCQWIDSGKPFHVMRDHVFHTELVLAGLWGGVTGALPDLQPLWERYVSRLRSHNKTVDQLFLRYNVWPRIKNHALIHDQHYSLNGAIPFPEHAASSGGRNVGYNDAANGKLAFVPPVQWNGRTRTRQRKDIVFPLTTGRSGTAFLTQIFRHNLDDAEVHHERTGPALYNLHTPEVRHFLQYNTIGATRELDEFWLRKFFSIQQGPTRTYVEMSHYLAKGGLMQYLHALFKSRVHIICLNRDIFKTAWSLANRFDFANTGSTWLFYLDPHYKRNLYPSTELARHGMLGLSLWYVLEMRLRAEVYKLRYSSLPNVVFHDVNLEDITSQTGMESFLRGLEIPLKSKLVLPPKANASAQFPLGQKDEAKLHGLIDDLDFDHRTLASEIISKSSSRS